MNSLNSCNLTSLIYLLKRLSHYKVATKTRLYFVPVRNLLYNGVDHFSNQKSTVSLCSSFRKTKESSFIKHFSYDSRKVTRDISNDNYIDIIGEFKTIFYKPCSQSVSEWEGIMSTLIKNGLKPEICDAKIIKQCIDASNFQLGASYMSFIDHQNRIPSVGTLALYLDLCAENKVNSGEQLILSVYEQLCARQSIFTVGLCERVIAALCQTSKWQQSFQHLAALKNTGEKIPISAIRHICAAAFQYGDENAAWEMLEQLCRRRASLLDLDKVCDAFTHHMTSLEQASTLNAVNRLAGVLGQWVVFPGQSAMEGLGKVLSSAGYRVSFSQVDTHRGTCRGCGNRLDSFKIFEKDFTELTELFLERVLKRGDIFLATSPTEWSSFERLLQEDKPFTHVVDGLNVAFAIRNNSSTRAKAENVLHVVQQVRRHHPDARVLIMCREHMRRWHRPTMNQLSRLATLYFVQNISMDDSFFLYSALHSGVDTKVITKDLLRNHLYKLGDARLGALFRVWQQRAQQHLVPGRPPVLLPPPSFTTGAQVSSDGSCIHVPYNDGSLDHQHMLPNTWLCATRGAAARQRTTSAGEAEQRTMRGGVAERHFAGKDVLNEGSRMFRNSIPAPRISKYKPLHIDLKKILGK